MLLKNKILLVEDDPGSIRIAQYAFARSGVKKENIAVAHNGLEAVEMLFGKESSSPLLILLDLKLPWLGGIDVLKRIRQEERTKGIPVIILTNSDADQDVVQSYDLGANSYLKKPVDFKQLIAQLKQLGLIPKPD